jgi:RNA polymerase sigma-70 factor (ECF subfamily)
MAAGTLEQPFASTDVAETRQASNRVEAVYSEYFRYVWRCLRALGVHPHLLDDAAHDVFVVVQQKLGAFDDGVPVTTWLYAITLRVARRARANARRDAWRYARNDTDESGSSPAHEAPARSNAERELECEEQLDLARRALDRLDEDKREAFVLSQVEQRSAPEIADITGVPLNTVYSRIRAAKLAFQAEVSRLKLVTRGEPT